ncbi:hypothetical protein D5086_010675 [Populus alba]|uniref:Uncharacterized protein n=2 Tax=Populus TaxID=3689 RepID=A0ACC4CBT7_POPAL|nr:hypothetical protein NC653_013729 [Populus alba x Populus x berolinensis]
MEDNHWPRRSTAPLSLNNNNHPHHHKTNFSHHYTSPTLATAAADHPSHQLNKPFIIGLPQHTSTMSLTDLPAVQITTTNRSVNTSSNPHPFNHCPDEKITWKISTPQQPPAT